MEARWMVSSLWLSLEVNRGRYHQRRRYGSGTNHIQLKKGRRCACVDKKNVVPLTHDQPPTLLVAEIKFQCDQAGVTGRTMPNRFDPVSSASCYERGRCASDVWRPRFA